MNDPTYVEAARALGEIMYRAGDTRAKRLDAAFRHILQRPGRPEELTILEQLYDKHFREYQADAKAANLYLHVGDRAVPADIPPAELATLANVARVVLNLHETITRD